MKNQSSLILLIFLFFSIGCSTQKLQKEGNATTKDFYSKVLFKTFKGLIGLDVQVNGETKNFLFDTGADLSLVQRDKISGKKFNISGASGRKMKLGTESISSLKIGDVEFNNTYAFNGNMDGLNEQIPNFGGLLGQSIIQKANWLIDYPNKQLEISNRNLADEGFKEILITRDNSNNPYTYLEFNNKKYKVVIDLGSTSTINLPIESEFAKEVTKSIRLIENTRERYTLGGMQKINEKVGKIPKIKLSDFDFEAVDVNINQSSQPRIGINFFKDFTIYIDSSNGIYKLKRSS